MNVQFTAFTNLVDLVLIFLFIKRIKSVNFTIHYFLSTMILITIMTLINALENEIVNLIMFYTILFLITWYLAGFKFAFIFSAIYIIIGSTSEMVTYLFVNDLCNMTLLTKGGSVIFIIINTILKYFTLFLYFPVKYLMKDGVLSKSILPIMILPLSFIFIIIGILKNLNSMNIYFQIGTILLLISNFVVIYVLYKVNESEKLKIEIYDNKIKEDINKLYYDLIEQKYNSNRIYIHDLNKHINILNSMMMKEEYSDMKLYLETMFDVSKRIANQICSGNKTLDLVLSNINEKFDTSTIDFYFGKIEDLTFKSKHLYSLISIVYNIIENAVESCYEKGGMIRISLLVNDTNYIIMKVINTSYKEDAFILKTNKKDHEKHGVGVVSIKSTVTNLKGSVDYFYDVNEKKFTTTVILPSSDLLE